MHMRAYECACISLARSYRAVAEKGFTLAKPEDEFYEWDEMLRLWAVLHACIRDQACKIEFRWVVHTSACERMCVQRVCVRVCVHTRVCVCVYGRVCVYARACMHVRAYARACALLYAHVRMGVSILCSDRCYCANKYG